MSLIAFSLEVCLAPYGFEMIPFEPFSGSQNFNSQIMLPMKPECDHSNESYSEQFKFPVVLFIMLHQLVLTFESVDEILKWDHSNESH